MNIIEIQAQQKGCIKRGEQWEEIAQLLYQARLERKRAELKEKYYAEQLQSLSGNVNSWSGQFLYVKIERKGTINYTAIPELQTINLEPYRKAPTTSWVLQILDDEEERSNYKVNNGKSQ